MAGQDHDAAAQAGAGNLVPRPRPARRGDVDHLVDLRRAARIAAGLHAELGPQHALGILAAQVGNQPLDIFVAAIAGQCDDSCRPAPAG